MVGRHGHPPVRAQHGAVAPGSVPEPALGAAPCRSGGRSAGARRGRRGFPTALRPQSALSCHPAPAGGGPAARTGDVGRQDPPGDGRAGAVRSGRRRSTAGAPRSNATSSPGECSTSGPTGDGRSGAGALSRQPPARDRRAHGGGARCRARRPRLAGRPQSRPACGGVDALRAAGEGERHVVGARHGARDRPRG